MTQPAWLNDEIVVPVCNEMRRLRFVADTPGLVAIARFDLGSLLCDPDRRAGWLCRTLETKSATWRGSAEAPRRAYAYAVIVTDEWAENLEDAQLAAEVKRRAKLKSLTRAHLKLSQQPIKVVKLP